MDSQEFIYFRPEVYVDPALSPHAKLLYILLCGFRDCGEVPTRKELARRLSMSVRSVDRALAHSRRVGLVTTRCGNRYELNEAYIPSVEMSMS